MGDGSAEGALGVGSGDVDVDPLVVAGRVGEEVHALLRDVDPVGPAEVPAGRAAQLVEGGEADHARWDDTDTTSPVM